MNIQLRRTMFVANMHISSLPSQGQSIENSDRTCVCRESTVILSRWIPFSVTAEISSCAQTFRSEEDCPKGCSSISHPGHHLRDSIQISFHTEPELDGLSFSSVCLRIEILHDKFGKVCPLNVRTFSDIILRRETSVIRNAERSHIAKDKNTSTSLKLSRIRSTYGLAQSEGICQVIKTPKIPKLSGESGAIFKRLFCRVFFFIPAPDTVFSHWNLCALWGKNMRKQHEKSGSD